MSSMKSTLSTIVLAGAMLASPLTASSAPVGSAPRAKLDAGIRNLLDANKTPGATLEILRDGKVVYQRGYGLADIVHHIPAQVGTHYQIGSMTKQFTAAAILQLRDAGKISLDSPVATYLPTAPHASEITVRELLNQTSGLANYTQVPGFIHMAAKPGDYRAILDLIKNKPLGFHPGSKWEYSNTNYILLGRIIEVVSHEHYENYVTEHEFAPAGMRQTTWIAHEANLRSMAVGYATSPRKDVTIAPPLVDAWAWSAGAIVSTTNDVARWIQALQSGKIVTRADFTEMTTPPKLVGDPVYGFGLMHDAYDGQPRIWHNGGTFGFSSTGMIFPAQHLIIVALTNSVRGPAGRIAGAAFDALEPSLAAAALRPSPGEDLTMTSRIKAFMLPLLQGHLNRALITPAASKRLPDAKLAMVAKELSTLGQPAQFIFRGEKSTPTENDYTYLLPFADGEKLTLNISVQKATNLFDTFSLRP